MKKLIALTLSAIFLLTVVAACTRYVPFVRDDPGQTTNRPWTTPPRTTEPPLVTDPPPRQPRPPLPVLPITTAPHPAPLAPSLPPQFSWYRSPSW